MADIKEMLNSRNGTSTGMGLDEHGRTFRVVLEEDEYGLQKDGTYDCHDPLRLMSEFCPLGSGHPWKPGAKVVRYTLVQTDAPHVFQVRVDYEADRTVSVLEDIIGEPMLVGVDESIPWSERDWDIFRKVAAVIGGLVWAGSIWLYAVSV